MVNDYDQVGKRPPDKTPISKNTGEALWWDYNARSGCRNADRRHVRARMKGARIRWAGLKNLARLGGISGGRHSVAW